MPDRERIESRSIRSDPAAIREARRWLTGILFDAGWSTRDLHDLAVALSEACSNAHRYAYGGRNDGRIDLRVQLRLEEVELAVRDFGPGFDPGRYRLPDLSSPREGGYGIFLMKNLTDHLEYRRIDAGTLVVMTKTKRDDGTGGTTERPAGPGNGMRNVG